MVENPPAKHPTDDRYDYADMLCGEFVVLIIAVNLSDSLPIKARMAIPTAVMSF